MINRRSFLVAGGGAILLPSINVKGQSNGSNSDVYSSSSSAHAICAVNSSYNSASANDWFNISNTLVNVYNDIRTNGLDEPVKQATTQWSANLVKSSSLNQDAILAYIQQFCPDYPAYQVQQSYSLFDDQPTETVQDVLNQMSANGISSYISDMINVTNNIGVSMNGGGSGSNTKGAVTNRRPPAEPPDGGGGYNCKKDGVLLAAAGLAVLTLSVMTLGGVEVLAGAAWGSIALWGGIGTGVWGAGHTAQCGF